MNEQASKPPAGGGRVYLKLLDHLADSAFLANSSGRLLFANVATCQSLGYTREELRSLSVPDITDDGESKLREAFTAVAAGEPVTAEAVQRRKDGTPVPVELRLSPIEIDGRLCLLGLARDITKRKQAEEQLRQHSERLEILFEYAPDAYYLNDLNGNFVDGNRAAEELSGYSREELIGKNFLEVGVLPQDQLPVAADHLASSKLGGHSGPHELILIRKDGTQVSLEITTYPTTIDGRPLVLGIARDVTERKLAEEELRRARDELESRVTERTADLAAANERLREEITEREESQKALRESEEKLRTLAETTTALIFIFQGPHLKYANPAAEAISGYSRNEWQSMDLWDLLHPDFQDLARERHGARQRGEDVPARHEVKMLTKDGEERWLDYTAAGVELEGEAAILGTAFDITDRKRAEEALQLSEQRLSEAQRIARVGNWDWDIVAGELWWSDEVYRIFGLSREEFGDTYESFLESVHSDDRDLVRTAVDAALYERKPYSVEHLIVLPNGDQKAVHERAEVTFDEDGRPVRMAGTVLDITERKRAEEALRESEEKLRSILETVPDIVATVAADGTLLYTNRRAAGGDVDEIIGTSVFDLVVDEDRDTVRKAFQQAAETGERASYEARGRGPDGTTPWYAVRIAPLTSGGEVVAATLVATDITERKQAEEALQESERRKEALLAAMPDLMFVIGRDGTYLDYHAPSSDELYVSPDEFLGKTVREIMPREVADRTMENIEFAIEKRTIRAFEYQLTIGGKTLDFEARYVPHGDDQALAMVRNITERKQAEATIERMAYHDALTGLPNRELLKDRLDIALAQARRGGNMVAVMYLDLDRFKNVNDTLGHPAGDKLLHRIGRQLSRLVRDGDTVARIGGDEFVMLLPTIEDPEDAVGVAARTLKRLSRKRTLLGQEIVVTASIGISLYPPDGDNAEDLLSHADTAMYRAKDRGRNQYQIYDPGMTTDIEKRLVMEAELRSALENDEIVAYFQPQLDVATGRLLGAEALARWHHPSRGLVLPGDFIQVAEETELSLLLTEQMLRSAAALHVEMRNKGLPPMRMAVNLGPAELYESALPQVVARILAKAGMGPEYLQVEITEQGAMRDPDLALLTLTDLRSQGVQIVVDDFGTGHSSLNYLRRFPASVVKVDRSFIRDLEDDPEDAAIVSAIISMAKSLNLSVVAEGVETEAQLQFLRERGCDEYQGYLFSPAIPAPEFEELLKTSATAAKASSRGAP